MLAYAEEDPIDEDEADVEGEEAEIVATESDEDVDEPQSKVSPDADTVLLFTKPNIQGASQLGTFTVIYNRTYQPDCMNSILTCNFFCRTGCWDPSGISGGFSKQR